MNAGRTVDAKTVSVKAQRMGQHRFISGRNRTVIPTIGSDLDSTSVNTQEMVRGLRTSSLNGDKSSVGNQIALVILHMAICSEGSRLRHAHEPILL